MTVHDRTRLIGPLGTLLTLRTRQRGNLPFKPSGMTKRSMPCLFHATLYALGAARLRMLNLLRSNDPLDGKPAEKGQVYFGWFYLLEFETFRPVKAYLW